MPTLRPFLLSMTARLEKAGVDSPRLSSEMLLALALGRTREELLKQLILDPLTPLSPEAAKKAESLLSRREKGEPAAYILGCKEFYGRSFAVNRHTLIPRPETELLLERAKAFALDKKAQSGCCFFADLGTGSGCIAVSLVLEAPGTRGIAVDVSPEALATAKDNASRLGATELSFLLADFHDPPLPPEGLDLITANPPYVSQEEYEALSPEVRLFEPRSALVPNTAIKGSGGVEDALAVLDAAFALLRPGGLLLMEIGAAQGETLREAALKQDWEQVRIIPDLAGLPRILAAGKRSFPTGYVR